MARVPKGVLDGLRGQASDPTQAYEREMVNIAKPKPLRGAGVLRKMLATATEERSPETVPEVDTPPSVELEREPDVELEDLMELVEQEPEPEPEQELEDLEVLADAPAPLVVPEPTQKKTKTKTTKQQRQKEAKKPSYMSIRHTKSPYATRRGDRHTRTLFRPEDVKRVDSRYVDLMKPLHRSTRRAKDRAAAGKSRLNIKPVVIHTEHRQLVVASKVLDDVVEENSHDKRLLDSLRTMGRIVPSATWMRYIMANARRFQQCHTTFLALDMATLAFMINLMYDATEFHNGERHRIEEEQLRYIVQEVWPVRNNPRPPLGEKNTGSD